MMGVGWPLTYRTMSSFQTRLAELTPTMEMTFAQRMAFISYLETFFEMARDAIEGSEDGYLGRYCQIINGIATTRYSQSFLREFTDELVDCRLFYEGARMAQSTNEWIQLIVSEINKILHTHQNYELLAYFDEGGESEFLQVELMRLPNWSEYEDFKPITDFLADYTE